MILFLKKIIKRAIYRIQGNKLHSTYLRESTAYTDIGAAGPLITDVFEQIKDVPGWFNVDDCGHFFLVLSYQSAIGLKGDLLEIGSYHGRSTALMAKCLKPSERIVVCDAFELGTRDQDSYKTKPTPETLMSNIERVSPELDKDRIIIHKCLSNDLRLDPEEMFRFVHIDGGHSAEQAYFDLKLCSNHVVAGGVIVMDDYGHRRWAGVTEGVDRFLSESRDFVVLADLNRHGAYGRKLYLIKQDQSN